MVLILPLTASAANRAKVSPNKLARAINRADGRSAPYRNTKISQSDIRITKCVAPDEEPTEVECAWRQRADHGWAERKTWLAIDGAVWRVID